MTTHSQCIYNIITLSLTGTTSHYSNLITQLHNLDKINTQDWLNL